MSQNVSKEILFTGPKNQVKFEANLKIVFREGDSYTHFKNGGLRDIGYSMGMVLDTKKSVFGSQQRSRFYIWFIMTIYYKMRQLLLQNARAILLQNVKKVYYNMRRLLSNASVHN